MSETFRYYLRVRYGECDAQYVVFNARYGDYIDLASTEYLKACFAGRDLFDGTFEYQVVRQLTEWKGSARFDDVVEVTVRPAKLGTTSFTLQFELRKAGLSPVLVTCETIYVLIDKESWQKRRITDAERACLDGGAKGQVTDHAGYQAAAQSLRPRH
jgi:acyl-CoA thioester hydrolase